MGKPSADEQQTSTGVAHSHGKKNAHSADSKLVHEMEIFIKQEPLDQHCAETGSDERDSQKSQIDVVKREACGNSSDSERLTNHSTVTEIQVKIEPMECTTTEIKESQRSRLTADQRWIMVEFLRRNKTIIMERCAGPAAARRRRKVLAQMAKTLNSTEDGAVKTPDKWLSSLHHWKSDVRKKAAKIASLSVSSRSTGRGPQITGLSAVERELLMLIGEPVVSDQAVVADSLGGMSSTKPNPDPKDQIRPSADLSPMAEPSEDSGTAPQQAEEPHRERKRKRGDEDDDRMASAMERQAEALTKISHQITRLTEFLTLFYNRWAQQIKD